MEEKAKTSKGLMPLFAFGLGLGVIVGVLDYLKLDFVSEHIWQIYISIFGIYLISTLIVVKIGGNIVPILLLSLVIRFFLAIIVAILFVFLFKANSFAFAINFGGIYLFFIGFEIYSLLTKFSNVSE
ncbi:hypothetical protein [Aureibacter tunicatorum]|uniref:Uncharacterized protein n=1 Tax=Aureibacter tunicatorum TaxID=866807 RepID=A0AAE3XI27_9BACT|nr:hypothetical protein [Aureibacter tunicatorum]MDR6237197.1 hypothetical protein [Aureibacter tunicatorum]BDD06189.1 hypothetical protein AUTU_36720 [Aureibacter tunicatorum]